MRPTKKMTSNSSNEEEFDELKRGPWTLEEDNLLICYITRHGEGRWNSLAKSSGLKRTGKSCRLRWLNYLKPDIKRGNLSPQEQLLILELHSKWGNRWSKIAQNLPGRTDNEIKNYWRTRVQKQARHLKIDSNSKRFAEALRGFWMPRLLEKVEQTSSSSSSTSLTSTSSMETDQKNSSPHQEGKQTLLRLSSPTQQSQIENINSSSSSICSSDSKGILLPQLPEISQPQSTCQNNDCYYVDMCDFDMMGFSHLNMQALGSSDMSALDFQVADGEWMSDDMASDTFWNVDELWQFRK